MRILVADDTKNIRLLLKNCLEIESHEVQIAADGLQALELLKSEKFDLVFLDIKMPEISGTEVLKRIREQGIDTPVIIITAFATVKNAVECTKMGAVSYLQKPFTADKVRLVLKEISNKNTGDKDTKNFIEQAENLINQDKFDKALVLLKKAISSDPSNAKVFLLLSKAYKGIKDNENAQKFYQVYQLFSK